MTSTKAKSQATPTKSRPPTPLAKSHKTSHRPLATASKPACEMEHSQMLDALQT